MTNVGEAGADIVAIHAQIWRDDLPALTPYTDSPGETVPPIHAGESRKIEHIEKDDVTIGEFHMAIGFNERMFKDQLPSNARKFYFLGYIAYKDQSIGIGHRTAFCRLYDYRKRRFMPMEDPDPDYEHAD